MSITRKGLTLADAVRPSVVSKVLSQFMREVAGADDSLDARVTVLEAGGGGGSVVARYDIDFSAAADESFGGGDGPYTIGGITWNVVGKSGASTFAITHGTGLTMTRNNTGTEPKIYASLKSMFPTKMPSAYGGRVWVETAPGSIAVPTNNSWVRAFLTPDAFSTGFSTGPRYVTGTPHWFSFAGAQLVGSGNLSDNVFGFNIAAWNNITCFSMTNAGDGVYDETNMHFRGYPPSQPNPAAADDWLLSLEPSSADLTSAVWKRARVELYR